MTPRRRPLARRLVPIALAALAAAAPRAGAQDGPAFEATGSARAAEWSRSRELDGAGPVSTAGVWARATARLGGSVTAVGDGWAQAANRGQGDASVRELFLKASVGAFDLRAGRQVVAWGRADGVNPTDSIGRRDWTRLAVDDTDQRDGTEALSMQWFAQEGASLQALWLPAFRSDTIPLHAVPGASVASVRPDRRTQLALKYDRTGGAVDWSVSWFDGLDRLPDLSIVGASPQGVTLALSSHRVRTLGADFSASAGGVTWRGELAWSHRGDTSAPEGFFRKRSQVELVAGGDRAIGASGNLNLQLFAQWVPRWRDPRDLGDPLAVAVATEQAAINNQPGRHQLGVTWRLSTSWANESWQAECSGIASFTTHANFARVQLKHALADRWRLAAGADRYAGRTDSVFGQLRDASTAWIELRRLF